MVSLLLAFGLSSLAFNVYNKHGKYDATAKENARLLFELENLKRAAATSDPVVLSPTTAMAMQVDSSLAVAAATQNADLSSGMQQA